MKIATTLTILSALLANAIACDSQYSVQSGEYCDLICQNNGLSLDDFLAINPGIDCNNLQIGQSVCVKGSAGCSAQYTVQSGDYCMMICDNNGLSLDQLIAMNPGLYCDGLQIGQVVCVKNSDDPNPNPNPNPNPDPNPNPNPNPDGINISFEQFSTAITGTSNGYPAPSEDQYHNFINNYATAGQISSTRELAMFLSEIMWESGGLQFKSELRCAGNNCAGEYRSDGDDPNKFYYGRGYIQLTWSYNYKAASGDLFGDDRLVQEPDQVANNDDVAWQTAFWFWRVNVHSDAGVQNGQFGSATNKINGALECNPSCNDKCQKRNEIYAHVLGVFGVNEQPNFAGC